MKYYFMAWKRYIKFHGRASRSEYWYFTFINIAISIALHQVCVRGGMEEVLKLDLGLFVFGQTTPDLVYLGAVLMPLICVGVRRMQDVNKTGWHLLIPIYGQYLSILDGVPEDNKYGSKATA